MKRSWRRLIIVVSAVIAVSPVAAIAQQNFPRPFVLYRPPTPASPARTQTNTNTVNTSQKTISGMQSTGGSVQPPTSAQGLNGNAPGSMNGISTAQTAAGTQSTGQPSGADSFGQNGQGHDPEQAAAEKEWAGHNSLPTNQMIQNPSGIHNMSHQGTSWQPQYAPNSYFGSQHQAWTNQRNMTESHSSYWEMSRFQVGQFGGYVAPNNYLGSGYSTWSNLSTGSATPSSNGGWTYSTWP